MSRAEYELSQRVIGYYYYLAISKKITTVGHLFQKIGHNIPIYPTKIIDFFYQCYCCFINQIFNSPFRKIN